MVRIVWPTAATITTPAHYLEVASAAMRLLAEAATTLARIRASRRLRKLPGDLSRTRARGTIRLRCAES